MAAFSGCAWAHLITSGSVSKAFASSADVPRYMSAWGQKPGRPMFERNQFCRATITSPGSIFGSTNFSMSCMVTRGLPMRATRVSPAHSAKDFCTGKIACAELSTTMSFALSMKSLPPLLTSSDLAMVESAFISVTAHVTTASLAAFCRLRKGTAATA